MLFNLNKSYDNSFNFKTYYQINLIDDYITIGQDKTQDLEDCIEYVWKTLGFTPDEIANKHKIAKIDYFLDDIIRIDFFCVS